MIIKPLEKSKELRIYQALQDRLPFSSQDKTTLQNLQQGYQGETQLESLLTERLSPSVLLLNDLYLQLGTTTFQLDSLIITGDTIFLLEVKHYAGNHKYEEKNWYKLPHQEITNPLLQIQRSESLLRRWLQTHHVHMQVESRLVFTHPQFFLYQAPLLKQFIFSSQLSAFIKSMNRAAPAGKKEREVAQQLVSADLGDYPYPELPAYSFTDLQKGIRCHSCGRLALSSTGWNLTCSRCGAADNMEEALLRHIVELQLLFPDDKLTSKLVYEWSGGIISRKRIKRLLEKHFKPVGEHSWVYYI
ncbi:nuclease-related domain-containing protein [Gracilibacillus timonensis]|uniref:nuclease-related domain-containing protein n=1 Tax=Gracilibacillus timonensis TaxID=1816696 RepID=UPI000826E79E|nr:nuclease-related domain-containing protein [Gracilibacillus timonensis]